MTTNTHMENLIKITATLFILAAAFFFVDLCGTRTIYQPSAVVKNVRKEVTPVTRRTTHNMDLLLTGKCVSMTGLLQWDHTQTVTVEITENASRIVRVGQTLTGAEIEDLRGKSNLNRAWDWLKRPR